MANKRLSKSVPPSAPHDESVSTGVYDYLNKPPKAWAENVVSDRQTSQSRIAGKDISRRVNAAAGVSVGVGHVGGYSGEVSRGHRPKHVAGKRSYRRV
jgi:hypothetical protein